MPPATSQSVTRLSQSSALASVPAENTSIPVIFRLVKTGGGRYLSSHDTREVLGLGRSATLDCVEITWTAPSGKVEQFTNLPVDRYTTIVEGTGAPSRTGGR